MAQSIRRDQERFREIVRGHIRKDLGKLISKGELIGRKGRDLVSIPIPHINLPKFRHWRNSPGVSQGKGNVGDPLWSSGDPDKGGEAGDQPGQHILEVEIPIEELAKMLGEELELPRIVPKGKRNITNEKDRYTGARRVGPECLRITRKTIRQMMFRACQSIDLKNKNFKFFDPAKHPIFIVPEDKWFRSWKTTQELMAAAAIIFIMDVSGSMAEEQKEIVRTICFWIESWLNLNFKGLRIHYIIHDAEAIEVDRDTFFHTRESGGTRISSAYILCNKLMKELPGGVDDWNIYAFQFSDGDNWKEDNQICVNILREEILSKCNLFGYVQVNSNYGSGEFIKVLDKDFPEHPVLISTEVEDRDGILKSIKNLLGKGR